MIESFVLLKENYKKAYKRFKLITGIETIVDIDNSGEIIYDDIKFEDNGEWCFITALDSFAEEILLELSNGKDLAYFFSDDSQLDCEFLVISNNCIIRKKYIYSNVPELNKDEGYLECEKETEFVYWNDIDYFVDIAINTPNKLFQRSSIMFGSYPQNGELSKKEPIEWIVLKKENNNFLCISKFLLDCKPYHETLEEVTWESCTLRKWLNNEFFLTAFTKEEQSHILMTNVETPLHNTQDHIFLLSCEEAEQYFDFDERAVKTTEYARKQGAWFLEDKEDKYENHGLWWLRYPEGLADSIEEYKESELYTVLSCVNFDGYVESAASEVNETNCCIRPAFWLKKYEKNNRES